jgi:protoporphyrin/coproporphyrin ferrochelatase
MPKYLPEPEFTHGTQSKVGILLVNLGTPDEPTASATRKYLKQFLSDPRVVEIPRIAWLPILHGIILNTRPKKSAAKYKQVWMKEGAPLRVYTELQAKKLKGFLGERIKQPAVVEYAMRYGNPSIASAVAKLKAQFCDRILLLPLYPQYASSTTASSQDELFSVLKKYRNSPAVRTVRNYHDHPSYIKALAQSVRDSWVKNGRPEKLLMSFHGVPQYTLDKGDPYHCECRKTGRLLAEALQLKPEEYVVSFQSLFGRAEWVKPYTSDTLAQLGKQGVKHLDVICPGFPADCLETLEEIAMEGRETFLHAGGKEYNFIPCLNERDDWIHALCDIALENLGGWVSKDWDKTEAVKQAEISSQQARTLGAKK